MNESVSIGCEVLCSELDFPISDCGLKYDWILRMPFRNENVNERISQRQGGVRNSPIPGLGINFEPETFPSIICLKLTQWLLIRQPVCI